MIRFRKENYGQAKSAKKFTQRVYLKWNSTRFPCCHECNNLWHTKSKFAAKKLYFGNYPQYELDSFLFLKHIPEDQSPHFQMKLSKIWPNEDLNLDGIKRICGRIKRYGTQRVVFKTHDVTLDSTFFALFCKGELPPDLKQVLALKCVPPWLLFFHILGSVVKVMSLPHSVWK